MPSGHPLQENTESVIFVEEMLTNARTPLSLLA